MNSVTAQNLTTLAVAGLGLVLAYIAFTAHRYKWLGQESLLCASAFIIAQAITRTLSINDIISADTARLIVGLSAFTSLAILGQLAWLKRKEHTYNKPPLKENHV